MLERSAASRFLAGYVVFPGGAVDGGDAVIAERWFGDAAEAARAAGVRELVEEAGLALTAERVGRRRLAGLARSDPRGAALRLPAP